MRILYGVQATGNGHTTRARTMATALAESGIEVDWLFSGRPRQQLFDMAPFGQFRCYPGLTFSCSDGRIKYLSTLTGNNLLRFVRDTLQLDLNSYDLVITDFEPVTAWAARIHRKPSLGISHQYAFRYDIPTAGKTLGAHLLMNHFAPAQRLLGFHWHHFNRPILPPLIEAPLHPISYEPGKILVYLPFENTGQIIRWLADVEGHQFHIYCNTPEAHDYGHLHLHRYDRDAFQLDLASCSGVIANGGFGLSSETIQYGKKLLMKPVKGQMEQLSNAVAAEQIGLADVMHRFDHTLLRQWLAKPNPEPRRYPCVARAIVEWISSGMVEQEQQLAERLWGEQCSDVAAAVAP